MHERVEVCEIRISHTHTCRTTNMNECWWSYRVIQTKSGANDIHREICKLSLLLFFHYIAGGSVCAGCRMCAVCAAYQKYRFQSHIHSHYKYSIVNVANTRYCCECDDACVSAIDDWIKWKLNTINTLFLKVNVCIDERHLGKHTIRKSPHAACTMHMTFICFSFSHFDNIFHSDFWGVEMGDDVTPIHVVNCWLIQRHIGIHFILVIWIRRRKESNSIYN